MKWTNTRDSIQTALAWAYLQKSDGGMVGQAILGCQIDKSARNGDFAMVQNLEAGQICAEINNQRPTIKAWLHFAYGPDNNLHDQGQVAGELMWKYFATVGGKWWSRYLELCHIAVLDYKVRVLSEGERSLPRDVYLSGVKIHRQDWLRRGWEERKEICLDTLAGFDKDGIARVSKRVKAIRLQLPIEDI